MQRTGPRPLSGLLPIAPVLAAALLWLSPVLAGAAATVAADDDAMVFVASGRFVDSRGTLAARPAAGMRYSVHRVVAPRGHRPGRVSRLFRSAESAQFASRDDFAAAAVAQSLHDFGTNEVLVFIHGFDNSFTESLDRAAQLAIDLDIPATTVLYAWPSANRLDRYRRDVAQVKRAREDLAALLVALADTGASRIVLVGHSLGARLALETLVDMKAAGDGEFFRRFGGLAMLAPDIPAADFERTMRRLPELGASIVVYGSSDDLVFRFAPAVAGVTDRLGDLRRVNGVAAAAVIVVDVTAVDDDGLFGHFPVVTSPTLIDAINALDHPGFITFAEALAEGALSAATVRAVGKATLVVLPPPPSD